MEQASLKLILLYPNILTDLCGIGQSKVDRDRSTPNMGTCHESKEFPVERVNTMM